MKTSEILRKAKALIDAPEKWTKGSFAKTRGGDGVLPFDEAASCWCAIGAVRRAEKMESSSSFAEHVLESTVEADTSTICDGVAEFNDHFETTHADVMALFDRAIAKAESEEAAK